MMATVAHDRSANSAPMVVQRALRVGATNDPAEAEADTVADRVMRMPAGDTIHRCACGGGDPDELRRRPADATNDDMDEDTIQAKHASGTAGGLLDASTAQRIDDARTGGTSLTPTVRQFFEPRFGADLSDVRIHTGHDAQRLAVDLNARAFTTGRHIFLGPGEHATTPTHLMAHELTHTIQQGGQQTLQDAGLPTTRRKGVIQRIPESPTVLPRGSTDYRFDTAQLTVEDLLREEVLVKLNAMSVGQLANYLDRTADSSVRAFIIEIIQAREAEVNAVGRRIVSIYEALPDNLKTPGGACFTVARGRVEEAVRDITGGGLTANLDAAQTRTFDRIWGSLISPQASWLRIPDNVRGMGAPGAMVYAGLGEFVDEDAIWAGELDPGAVIQVWRLADDADTVKAGNAPDSYGHSFIFLRYVRSQDGTIEGIEIADQGFQSGATLTRDAYGWWIGANITIRGERKFIRPWSLVYPGIQP